MASTARYAAAPAPIAHALLSRPHAGADTLLPDDGSDCESVADSSCPGPYSHRPAESGDCDEEDDDGCSSCVEGNDLGCYDYPEGEGEEEEVSTASVWWKKRLAAAGGDGGAFPPAEAREEAEDPERAAARQAEDRKFWEDCLGTGYPSLKQYQTAAGCSTGSQHAKTMARKP